MYQRGVQNTLQAGSIIFGLSAIFLLIAPGLFLELLKLPTTSELIWAMRMIGITLVALSGNMWQNSKLTNAAGIKFVAQLMFLSALALGLFTIFIPAELAPFTIFYAVIGLGFALSYLINLTRK
jgi:hypothetical protein